MLVNLMLLRQPRTKMIYVTSQQLDPTIVDYYLSLLPGVPSSHARRRLVMFHCNDASNISLTQKVPNGLDSWTKMNAIPDKIAHIP